MGVGEVVEEGEEDGEGFLHAHVAVEGPFAVELEDWGPVGRIAGEAGIGYDVLAVVVAFGGTGPEEQAALESCESEIVEAELLGWEAYGLELDCRRNWLVYMSIRC